MFRRKPTAPPEFLVVGLGNPGSEYRGTRHNVGFEVVDRLAEQHGIRLATLKHGSRYGQGTIGNREVVLAKPVTFMNRSGGPIAQLLRAMGLDASALLVIADELDLEPGRVSMKPKGGAAGHNGHRSIIAAMGTNEYARIRIGIGKPPAAGVEHVLGRFSREESEVIEAVLDRTRQAAELFVTEGLDRAMAFVNSG
ncbi:MAG: aminoacyl-tRNA hydrolase [Fimbriimonadaceae bacterium]|nr:aminoacyl-tRNA hydrolase [Fimbriimonadaceae bacterium]